jgi:hypothetical protein
LASPAEARARPGVCQGGDRARRVLLRQQDRRRLALRAVDDVGRRVAAARDHEAGGAGLDGDEVQVGLVERRQHRLGGEAAEVRPRRVGVDRRDQHVLDYLALVVAGIQDARAEGGAELSYAGRCQDTVLRQQRQRAQVAVGHLPRRLLDGARRHADCN